MCSLMTISPAMVLVVMSDKQNFHWTPWINIIHLSDITNTPIISYSQFIIIPSCTTLNHPMLFSKVY